MKKTVALFILLCGFMLTLHGQQVQLNAKNQIEVNAKSAEISSSDQAQIEERLKAYDVFEFNLLDLKKLVRQHADQASIKFNFPGKKPIELSIHEHELRPDSYRATAMTENGLVDVPRAECHTYKGFTEAGEKVRLSVTDELIYGFIEIEGKMLFIQNLSRFVKHSNANLMAVYYSDAFKVSTESTCTEEDVAPSSPPGDTEKMNGCFHAQFATEADFEQFTALGTIAATNALALGEMNAAEGFYDDEFGLVFEIVFQNVWATAADPYMTLLTANDEVEMEIAAAWAVAPLSAIVRDYVILFTGRVGFAGGSVGQVFTIGAMCSIPAECFAFVSIPGADAFTTSHEIGHSMGGLHGDSENCSAGNNGTLMCATIGQASFTLSTTNRQTIASHISSTGCLLNGAVNTRFDDNTIGAWTQDTNDDFNWTIRSGGTPSNATGPTGAYQGSRYLYTEATSNFNNTARITSVPYYVCPGQYLSFGYHMFGSNMGTMTVEASTDNGATFNSIWTRSGNHGSVWLTASVFLNAFAGQTIILRISGTTGSSFRSDMAIDDIAIGDPCPISTATTFIAFPTAGGSQNVWVSASSWEAHTPIPNWVTVNSFGSAISITAEPNTSNNSRLTSVNVSCGPSLKNITIVQSGVPTEPCSGSANIPNNLTFESTFLSGWTQDPNDDFDWTRQSGGTSSNNTGPSSAAQGNFYMYTEASSNFNDVANLVSPCYNLAEIPSPKITFKYHMRDDFNDHMGSLRLQVSKNGGATWFDIWSKKGNQGTSWISEDVSLENFTSGPFQLRFKGTTGPGWRSDMAIDDIQVKSGGECYDQYEDNNSINSAYSTTIGTNVTYNNPCLYAGDNDYYRYIHSVTGPFNSFVIRVKGINDFTVGDYGLSVTITGNNLVAETFPSNGSSTDTYMYLYNNAGALIAQNDNGGQGLFSKISTSVPNSPGTAIDRSPDETLITNSSSFELTNYPNPFNQTTNFDFYLANESNISLIITDLSGKVVAMPIGDVFYKNGNHKIEFDASALPAGVYNYSLKSEYGVETKQMVIVR